MDNTIWTEEELREIYSQELWQALFDTFEDFCKYFTTFIGV